MFVVAGVCYAGCAAVTVACFSAAAGFTFGTVPVIAATPALAGCNDAAFGVCEAARVAANSVVSGVAVE